MTHRHSQLRAPLASQPSPNCTHLHLQRLHENAVALSMASEVKPRFQRRIRSPKDPADDCFARASPFVKDHPSSRKELITRPLSLSPYCCASYN